MNKKAFQSNANRSLADRCLGYIAKKFGGDGVDNEVRSKFQMNSFELVVGVVRLGRGHDPHVGVGRGSHVTDQCHHGSGHMGTPCEQTE